MAFDTETRNRLQRFVSAARKLLTSEFTKQFQSEYGIDPKSGEIAELSSLEHLDDGRRNTAHLLREIIAHYQNTEPDGQTEEGLIAAIDRVLREQAFTVLNRFAALRMAEERKLILESIRQGEQSEGFQIYQHGSGSGMGERYHQYRAFIFSIFDELSLDLGVLFDRFSPHGMLFPGAEALGVLLTELNQADLAKLWAEDETIGWIYQYWNSKEERKAMRKASPSAPRNSRELAVRNQFFTPRYVVEFLADNTLGRLWYEMTKGETCLTKRCRYLIRRPTEIFLGEGEDIPDTIKTKTEEAIGQEELLKQLVHIPHRPAKDPREIRLLDPACGSMHFGLYAFDLFEAIYEEAWDKCLCPSLHEAYAEKADYLRDVPRLVIEHNIHGIDIDPRAVQIAGLSLWLRAQRTWKDTPAAERPRVLRSNIVCAEPMPGSDAMLEEFVQTLDPPLLGELVQTVFEKMRLAGEAGPLLKIEVEIRDSVDNAKAKWEQLGGQDQDLFSKEELNKTLRPGAQQELTRIEKALTGDLRPLTKEFWDTAEERIYTALQDYAESAKADDYQRRLFAEDAAHGFAFIDLCRQRYDAVVMNPPFGAFSKAYKKTADGQFPNSSNDIYAVFVERLLLKLANAGLLGAITSRACFFTTSFIKWRKDVVKRLSHLRIVADLGESVMDDAMVEAAAYVLQRRDLNQLQSEATFWCREFVVEDRESGLLQSARRLLQGETRDRKSFLAQASSFELLDGEPFVYWVEPHTIELLARLPALEPTVGEVRKGLRTGDNFRFVRSLWEIDNSKLTPDILPFSEGGDRTSSKFVPLVLSGSSQPWFSPLTVALNWGEDGRELRTYVLKYGGESRLIQGKDFYFRPGVSWTRRATRFIPYAVPAGCIPTGSRPMAFPTGCSASLFLAVVASNVASAFMRFYGEKFLWPNFLEGKVKLVPWPDIPLEVAAVLEEYVRKQVEPRRLAYRRHEPFHEFLHPHLDGFDAGDNSLEFSPASILGDDNEETIRRCFGLTTEESKLLCSDLTEALRIRAGRGSDIDAEEGSSEDDEESVVDDSPAERARSLASYLLGACVGRWDIRYATGERRPPALPDPFDPLPACPPGMLQNAEGLPAASSDVPDGYPLRISWPGILVDDEGQPEDIVGRIRDALTVIWGDRAPAIERETCENLGLPSLRDYFGRFKKGKIKGVPVKGFFEAHLERYSKSKRSAPIYWPISTESGSYTLWIYYHRLTDQTLFTAVNDFVSPKIEHVTRQITRLQSESERSRDEDTELDRLLDFDQELQDFRAELLRLADLPWKPNLNDGVQITAAPLWKLFRFKTWQTKLKDTWKKLEKGDYDWAHLAYTLRPDEVREKCKTDKSLAIAHGLDDLYIEPPARAAKKKRAKKA